ncbi:hypothetical protein [Mucilaginibacter sp. UYCu711]|uniref:hypothetical protein n=1 Tax=Mucilaginibacter sp. UYCu711 TaxID=3156339 RepID=UPI003D1B3BD0
MLAEIELRNYLERLGYGDRISQGGWIVRSVGSNFGEFTSVLFPHTIQPGINYDPSRTLEGPSNALHTICSTMHQIGVHSYYCVPSIAVINDASTISWNIMQLGIPGARPYTPLNNTINNFLLRSRRYNFLRYHTNSSQIPIASIPEEFTKEHLRISFQNSFMSEMSDIDGVLWGEQHTYPIEIKEKTVANDSKVGAYFGLDVGPFVKLAFYAAKKGNLHSLFFVREINNVNDRELVNWWFITFDTMAQYASWIPMAGGKNMLGGASTVIKIPKAKFTALNSTSLSQL